MRRGHFGIANAATILSTLALSVICAISSDATTSIVLRLPECTIFASDGRVSSPDSLPASDTYQKIAHISKFAMVQVGEQLLLGSENLSTVVGKFQEHFAVTPNSSIKIDSVVKLFAVFINSKINAGLQAGAYTLRFAGVDSNGILQYYEFAPTQSVEPRRLDADDYGFRYFGNIRALDRLFKGIDPIIEASIQSLVLGMEPDNSRRQFADSLRRTLNRAVTVGPSMPSWSKEDAVNYVLSLLQITTTFDAMTRGQYSKDDRPGKPVTGGKLLISVVDRNGVEWVLGPQGRIWNCLR